MNYIQLKESVIRLNNCLKILPDEDKAVLKRLVNKYNKQIKVFANVDFTNEVFTTPENRSIGTFVGAFRKRKVNPFKDEIERIEESIAEETGFNAVIVEHSKIYDRLSLIYDKRYSYDYLHRRGNYENKDKFLEKSTVYKNSQKKYTKFYNVYEKKLSESVEYKEAEEKLGRMQVLLHGFEFNAEIKNYIAMRKLITENCLYVATLETITNEAEIQFRNYETSK